MASSAPILPMSSWTTSDSMETSSPPFAAWPVPPRSCPCRPGRPPTRWRPLPLHLQHGQFRPDPAHVVLDDLRLDGDLFPSICSMASSAPILPMSSWTTSDSMETSSPDSGSFPTHGLDWSRGSLQHKTTPFLPMTVLK